MAQARHSEIDQAEPTLKANARPRRVLITLAKDQELPAVFLHRMRDLLDFVVNAGHGSNTERGQHRPIFDNGLPNFLR